MKVKNERGVTGIDIATGLLIFVIASAVVVNLYFQIYVTTIQTKVHEVAVSCITDIFEKIDLEDYDDITEARIAALIEESGLNKYFSGKDGNKVEYSLSNYAEENDKEEDLVKKINITVVYKVGEREITFPINKIKIRE